MLIYVHHWWLTVQLVHLIFCRFIHRYLIWQHSNLEVLIFHLKSFSPILFSAKECQQHNLCHLQDMISDIFTIFYVLPGLLVTEAVFHISWDSFTEGGIQLRKNTMLIWISATSTSKGSFCFAVLLGVLGFFEGMFVQVDQKFLEML